MPNKRKRNRNRKNKKTVQRSVFPKPVEKGKSKKQNLPKDQKKPRKIKKWDVSSTSTNQKEVFYVKKVTGKYMCSITDTSGPIKKMKQNQVSPKNQPSIQNLTIKEDHVVSNSPNPVTASLGLDTQGHSQMSKGVSSDNSRNPSEMSLILTPYQVKKKQEKFTQSLKQIKSMKSKFGTIKQAHNSSQNSIDNNKPNEENWTEHNDSGFKQKENEFDQYTRKTDLSGSDESMFKMFNNLNLSDDSDSEEKELADHMAIGLRGFSGDSKENFDAKEECFLDLDVNKKGSYCDMLKTPMLKDTRNGQGTNGNTKSSWNSGIDKGRILTKFRQGSGGFKIGWTSHESEDAHEKSIEVLGGFKLMNLMENPLLKSDKFPKRLSRTLKYGTSQTLVRQLIQSI
jgi:hypothetical protein